MKYYTWDEGNYQNGIVFPFKTKKDAIKHIREHHANCDTQIFDMDYNKPEDIYTGE